MLMRDPLCSSLVLMRGGSFRSSGGGASLSAPDDAEGHPRRCVIRPLPARPRRPPVPAPTHRSARPCGRYGMHGFPAPRTGQIAQVCVRIDRDRGADQRQHRDIVEAVRVRGAAAEVQTLPDGQRPHRVRLSAAVDMSPTSLPVNTPSAMVPSAPVNSTRRAIVAASWGCCAEPHLLAPCVQVHLSECPGSRPGLVGDDLVVDVLAELDQLGRGSSSIKASALRCPRRRLRCLPPVNWNLACANANRARSL